jgi:HSP20 family protein
MYPSLMRFPGDLFTEFDTLQRQVEQLMGLRSWPSSIRAADRGAFPAVNMGTTAEAVQIYAFAPGIDFSKLEVSIDKGLLTIAGERATGLPQEGDKLSVYARERFAGNFKRVVSLPDDVDTARVEASYRDGILRISIPKAEASKPRRIEVREASH